MCPPPNCVVLARKEVGEASSVAVARLSQKPEKAKGGFTKASKQVLKYLKKRLGKTV